MVKEKKTDILVLQTGSIEITDMNIKDGLKNPPEKIEAHKHDWFRKVEMDSTNLFNIAQDALANDKHIKKVVILKRLPRYDNVPDEISKIKSDLSEYGNQVYDQIMLRRGHPSNIQIIELNLKCSDSQYLKNIIFGNPGEAHVDGVHLRGKASSRHFTYRAVQAILPIIKQQRRVVTNQRPASDDSPSANHEPVFSQGPNRDYADAVNGGKNKTHQRETGSSIPTQNRFSSFYDNQGN